MDMNPDLRTGYILAAAHRRTMRRDFGLYQHTFQLWKRRRAEAVHEDGKAIHERTVNS